MRIADTIRVPSLQFVKPLANTMDENRQASNVSREERMHLLTEKRHHPKSGPAPEMYGERAQLLSSSGLPQNSWVA